LRRARKLNFEPISTDDYLDRLKDLTTDKKSLTDRYRQSRAYEIPAALSAAENTLRVFFRPLFDFARSLSAKQIVPLTTDEQIAAEQGMIDRWNAAAASVGWDVRLEQFGAANNGGLRIIELRSGAAEDAARQLKRGEWLSDTFAFLWLTGESEPVHPAMFEAQARRHWEERLRQRVEGKAFADLADSRERAILLDVNQRKERARHIRRKAENLNAHLTAHGVDALVPANWPTKDGVTPIARPHEARNEIVVDPKTGKKTALFVASAVQRAIWLHRGWWNFLEWSGHKLDLTPALKLIYLQRQKLLPTPRLQQLLKRWGRLMRIDNSNYPNHLSPFSGERHQEGVADFLEKYEDDGQSGHDDRDGPDFTGDGERDAE
jgi:hypothetical protein